MQLELSVNGRRLRLDAPPHWTLLRVLRELVGTTDVKYGCGEGVCGACAVFVDGVAANACSVIAQQVDGANVETAAGLAGENELHPLQAELVARGAVQCGFCTPGIMIAALEALRLGTAESATEIRESLAGNLCRCTGYAKIIDAVEAYRALLETETAGPAGTVAAP